MTSLGSAILKASLYEVEGLGNPARTVEKNSGKGHSVAVWAR